MGGDTGPAAIGVKTVFQDSSARAVREAAALRIHRHLSERVQRKSHLVSGQKAI